MLRLRLWLGLLALLGLLLLLLFLRANSRECMRMGWGGKLEGCPPPMTFSILPMAFATDPSSALASRLF